MKRSIKQLILVILAVSLYSCTDVIEVEVPVAAPRLVVEASLDWEKGTPGNEQRIKLSTSSPYFEDDQDSPATGASVKVVNNSSATEFVFTDQNDGTYTTSGFVPVLNQSYTLEILYEGEVYTATETLRPVPGISGVEQSIEGGFDDEVMDVTVYFPDPEAQENYYLVKFYRQGDLFPYLEDMSDEFTNGNEMFNFFEKEEDEDINQEELMPGDVIEIALYGISERYYNYIRLLIAQSDADGNPFSATPAALIGNCINETDPDNPPYGYFRLTEVDRTTYTIK